VTGPVVFRCDGSARVGLGHVIRCVALAQAVAARGGRSLFIMREDAGAVPMVEHAGFAVERLPASARPFEERERLVALAPAGGWVVLDGYELPHTLPGELRRRERRVLRIVDGPAQGEADLFVNPNLHAPAAPGPAALFGARYALLRAEFLVARQTQRLGPSGPPGLLTMFGGSDVAGLTPRVLGWLAGATQRLPPLALTAVLGPSAPTLAASYALAASSALPIRVLVAPANLAEIMSGVDLAITAAGGTVLELCALGVPPLAVTVADNQAGIAAALAASGAGIDLGRAKGLEPTALLDAVTTALERRSAMAAAARGLVDGGGAARVAQAMEGAQ
jgi:UDP-2,4-diacetamido-2,4,6-trideoxy-beta-L-altropyranose hydrolase